MGIFKCKMCGGTLEFEAGSSVGVCDSCGTKQTLSKTKDEVIANLFNRANNLRLKCEFDKAEQVYESILQRDETDAEAHWGMVLCKYGIEYVDDPGTGKKIPTCHRTLFEAVTADVDYQAAVDYADVVQQGIYETEARAIDRIQKGILEIVKNEKPFDVFICYKESDADGKRTVDSVIANDIYHQLTQEGLKVFYAAITLEDKLGQEYEPYIFAALNSAKAMLVLGTKPEYFTAVWVKNEWSRFLKLMKTDRSRILIPCFRDMDAYDLPEDFAHLQAQDMSKIGFINDVVRGIKKITTSDSKKTAAPQTTVIQSEAGNIEALLDRGNMALEDGEWAKADEFFEQVLNLDSRRAEAYLGKFLAAERCADLEAYARSRAERAKPAIERREACAPHTERIEATVQRYAVPGYLREATIRDSFAFKFDYVSELSGWEKEYEREERYLRDNKMFSRAESFAQGQCKKDIETGKQLLFTLLREKMDARKAEEDAKITEIIANYEAFLNEAEAKAEKLYEEASQKREEYYSNAVAAMEKAETESDFKLAAGHFQLLRGYRDAEALESYCREREVYYREQSAEVTHREAQKRARRNKKIAIIAAAAVCAVIPFIIHLITVIIPNNKYNNAVTLMGAGQYIEAITVFVTLDDYEDARERLLECWDYAAERETVSAGRWHTVGLKSDGTVVAVGENDDGRCDVSGWTDIVAVSAGSSHTVGLKSDGTVVAVGDNVNCQCDVDGWTDIVAVSAGGSHTIGLKSDGTVVAVGDNDDGQCNVSGWSDIVAVSAGDNHTVGLKADGTVVAVGSNSSGKCNVSGWRDIVAVSAGERHTVGLKSDGTVVAVGDNDDGQCNVSGWSDIVAVSAGDNHTVGLKAYGTVAVAGYGDFWDYLVENALDDWRDIVALSGGRDHTVGLKSDGSLEGVCVRDYGQIDVDDWTDIKTPE